jgi:hypothetical protein
MIIVNDLKKILNSDSSSHGLILVSKNIEQIKNDLTALLKKSEGSENNDAPLIDTEFFSSGDNGSLGIDAARRLKEFLFQLPIKSSKKTAVIVSGDTLTLEAQNALLKISEDPPAHARIIIIVKSEENLLPTLRSRFHKMYLGGGASSKGIQNQIPEEVLDLAKRFLKGDGHGRSEVIKMVIGKNTEASEAGTDKTLVFLDALIFELRREPIKYASFFGAVLERKALIASFSLNKRLHLEFLSNLWYNR